MKCTNDSIMTPQNRKNDEASYEKMLKLRRDLSRAVTILEMIKKREKSKRELLHLTLEVVEKRYIEELSELRECFYQCCRVHDEYTRLSLTLLCILICLACLTLESS